MANKTLSLKLFIFLFFLCTISFGQKLLIKENVFTPESEENIIHNASMCIEFKYPGDTVKFNSNGKITYYNTGSRITKRSYYSNGLIEKEIENTTYNSDGSSDTYEYDQYENITKHESYLSYAWESHYATEINEYVYRDSLLVSSLKYYIDLSYNSSEIGGSKDSTMTIYFYDSSNRLIKEEEKHTLYHLNDETCEYSYNEKGQLISVKIYKGEDNTLKSSIDYIYDDEGNIISRVITEGKSYKEYFKYSKGKMIEKNFRDTYSWSDENITCKYEYDQYGNVLKVMRYSADGKKYVADVISRKYQYINE